MEQPKDRALGATAALVAVAGILLGVAGCAPGTNARSAARTHEAPLPGKATAFDPFGSVAKVGAFVCPDAELASLTARAVTTQGTVDLTSRQRPRIEYMFLCGAGAERQRVEVLVAAPGTHVYRGQRLKHRGMLELSRKKARSSDVGPGPVTCSVSRFLKDAQKEGAPKDDVATVVVDARGYTIHMQKEDVHLAYKTSCESEQLRGLRAQDPDRRTNRR